jgi:hypothetical protein
MVVMNRFEQVVKQAICLKIVSGKDFLANLKLFVLVEWRLIE